ncbi:SAM-dependent methyltransferase [Corallincola luteus]|uniref:SAM-dependent methyltransferase n=1 Tax=Corallincola luteus TaxID=1775177 RepID=UPI001F0E1ED5|nr:SAM-dependent methyltransferase [Corallincola luteus]
MLKANNLLRGKLVITGFGIQLGRHLTRRVESELDKADVVLAMMDDFSLTWLKGKYPALIDLSLLYGKDGEKDRRQTYREMELAILEPLRAGKNVCAIFYGHPGVFADVPHAAIKQAREEGYEAIMEPAISADACLYADLGLDPGMSGLQSYEATQFLVYQRPLDPSALVVLWQIGVVGDLTCTQFHTYSDRVQALVTKLLRWYEPEHEVILYEAAVLPIEGHREERLPLSELPNASFKTITTLVIPPKLEWLADHEALASLGVTEDALL